MSEFSVVWFDEGIIEGAMTIEDMASSYERAASELRKMAADGVKLVDADEDNGDYELATCDEEIAGKYSMQLSGEWPDEDEDEDDDDDDPYCPFCEADDCLLEDEDEGSEAHDV